MMSDTISQPADILQASMDDGPGELDAGKCTAETRLPERPVIPLGSQIRPESKHELSDNFPWGGVGTACIANGRSHLVLGVG